MDWIIVELPPMRRLRLKLHAVRMRHLSSRVGQYYLGYDKATNRTVTAYSPLLHAVIADSISMGCRRLSLGRTALEPKARPGARSAPLNVWIRHRHPMMNQLLRPFVGPVPHGEAPERSPFKEG